MTPTQLLKNRIPIEREICERSFYEFLKHFWPDIDPDPYSDNWHIRAICDHLEAVSRGEISRLLINIPPRCMKSIATSVAWPAWIWAQKPSKNLLLGPSVRFLAVSHSFNLSVRDARKCRLLIKSKKYQRYWRDRFSFAPDQDTKIRYENSEKGNRICLSTEGRAATGEGGDIIIVDDPLDANDRESETKRNAVIEWWGGVLSSRLNRPKSSAIVIIMQRLHHQDLAGHILQHETNWTHLCLPMRYEHDHPHVWARDPRREDGDLLWPQRLDEKYVENQEATMGSYVAAGQLQQRPSPRHGGMFDRAFAQIVKAAPANGRKVRGWDLAGTQRNKSPWTCGVLIQRTGNEYYVLDVSRGRWTPKMVHDAISNLASQDGRATIIDFPQDPGQAGKDQRRIIAGELSGYNVRSTRESGAKPVRAEPFSAQWEAGNVYLVEGPWNKTYLDELEQFPNSDFMDQVDASSRAFARLSRKAQPVGGGAISV